MFWRPAIPPSSDKEQQNQAATQQIQQNKTGALSSLSDYLKQNPGPLAGAAPPQMPQQFGGQAQGQNFGGQPQPQLPPAMNGQPNPAQAQLHAALQARMPQGQGFQGQPGPGGPQMPGQGPPPAPQQQPAGLLALLQNRPG